MDPGTWADTVPLHLLRTERGSPLRIIFYTPSNSTQSWAGTGPVGGDSTEQIQLQTLQHRITVTGTLNMMSLQDQTLQEFVLPNPVLPEEDLQKRSLHQARP
jgi:hypothetical protein